MNTVRNPKQEKMEAALRKAHHDAATTVGAEMSNGGTILAIKKIDEDDRTIEYIVLALVKGFQNFVTWRYVVGITDLATGGYGPTSSYCWSGDYFRDLGEAYQNFLVRAGYDVQDDD
jgi:hypothetical protein